MTVRDTRIVLGSLLALIALATPSLGEAPTRWRVGTVHAHGLLGPLVRAATRDGGTSGVLRAPALAVGLLVALLLVAVPWLGRARGWIAIVATVAVAATLLVPAVALQAGLRDATAPWFHDNDSTYQIDLAGDLVRHGTNPYGHDYRHSGPGAHLLARRQPRSVGRDEPRAAPLPLPARHGHRGHGLAAAACAARRHPLPRLPREPGPAGGSLGISRDRPGCGSCSARRSRPTR